MPDASLSYMALVQRFALRPLRSDENLTEATDLLNELLDRQELDEGQRGYLEVLGDLVERYESEAHPMAPVSDAEMLRHLIEAKSVTQAEVARATGIAESTISAVLSGKPLLSRRHIGKLAHYFNVEPAVFFKKQ